MKNISKKFLSLLISVCMVISVFPLTASAAGVGNSWQYVGESGFSDNRANYVSMAVDSGGTPFVAYQDTAQNNRLTVKEYTDSGWRTVGDAGFSTDTAYFVSLAFGNDNVPYVAYSNGSNNTANVKKFEHGSWVSVGNADFSSGVLYTSLKIASDGTPYIAYEDNYLKDNKTTVMKYSESSGWQAVGSAGFSNGAASYVSLALDSNDTPYVAFQETYNYSRKATVMKYSGNSWDLVGQEGFSASTSYFISLAFDSNDSPYVAYSDGGHSNKATVMEYTGGSWQAVGSLGFSAGNLADISFVFYGDTPYIAYEDKGNANKATVMEYTDGSWQAVGSAGFSADAAYSTSLAFASDGTPYIAYSDENHNYQATVMKWAEPTYTVAYNPGAHGTLSSSGTETVTSGGTPSHVPTVTPANGYRFAGWSSDGGATLRTDLSGVTVTSDVTYTARYIKTFPDGYQWQPLGSSGLSTSLACHPSMAIDGSGTPYVAFQDLGNGHKATVMKYCSGIWQPVGIAGFSQNLASNIAFALDSNNTPYVAYQDGADSCQATVMKYTGSSWQTVGSPRFSASVANSISLAIDSSGTPYVAYVDTGNGNKATVMKYMGGVWQAVGTPAFSAGAVDHTVLALDGRGTPYVAYQDTANLNKLTVMKYSGGSWEPLGTAGFSAGVAYQISLVFDGNDTPYAAYQDNGSGGCATVMKYSGGTWQAVGTPGFSGEVVPELSLAVDSCGTPYAAYMDEGNYNRAIVMKYTGSAWQTVGNADFSDKSINTISIAFDCNDTPYVSFLNTGEKVTVMTYAELPSSTVTYSAGLYGSLNGALSETVNSGASPQSVPTVTPDSGYTFAGWSSDGGVTLYSSDQLRGLAVTANVTYTAYYTEIREDSSFTQDGIAYEVIGTNPNRVKVVAKGNGESYSGSVTVPASVTNNSITYDVTEVGDSAFSNCHGLTGVILPAGITAIGERAFESCNGLTAVTLPASITAIGESAFQSCNRLTAVTFPAGLTSIGDNAFNNCTNLRNVNLPSMVTSIGSQAFLQCTALTGTVYLPAGVASVGDAAFAASGITGFTVDAGNTHYCAVDGVLFSKDKTRLVEYPGRKGGSNYSIPSGVTSIADFAFVMSASLTDVTIPSSVTSIGAYAFAACSGLTGITIPASVNSIDAAAFCLCSSLTTAKFNGGRVPTLLNTDQDMPGVFASCSALRAIYVPMSALPAYQDNYLGFGVASSDIIIGLAALPSPTGLSWNGTSAAWSAVENASGYTVQLYKNGTTCGSAAAVNSATHQYDFSAAVAAAGSGTYTFTVTANGGTNYSDSTASPVSAEYSYTAGSSSRSSSTAAPAAPANQTQVNAGGNTSTVTTVADSVTTAGDTAQITAAVTNITTDTTGTNATLNTGAAARVEIELPKDAIEQQLAAKKDVDLTVSVPHSVAQGANPALSVDIKAAADILAAAKASETDLTIKIKDADTQQIAYTWTFKGTDLAKSTTPVTDVNVSMAVRLTTEVPQVNRVTPDHLGLVLMFDHSGVLPSVASVTFSAKEKGFKPGQKLYFYYYNQATGQIDAQNQEYTVGPDGMVTVQISHCSNYVLLPNKARTIALDTRTYTLAPGQSYVTGVKLTGVSGTTIKAYSSTKGAVDVTVLKNGNVKATGLKTGMTYIMIDVYDSKHKLLTHASVRLTVKNGVKPNGNSARQYGIF